MVSNQLGEGLSFSLSHWERVGVRAYPMLFFESLWQVFPAEPRLSVALSTTRFYQSEINLREV
jgi:hypothetical protein